MQALGDRMKVSYTHTLFASYIGYIAQAIVNNFVPLLFLTFNHTYGIPLSQITLLVTINFGIQLVVDLLAARYVDRIGYRISVVGAHLFVAVGLMGLGIFPELFKNPYHGLLLAISLLHSFYCWGHMGVVLISTAFFTVFGIANWKVLAFLWALIPLTNAFYFSQVPIQTLHEEGKELTVKELFQMKLFWIFVLLMICSGASEQAMNQWASAFAESGLKVSKTMGDLAGPCLFAMLMGISRVFYAKFSEKISLQKFMIASGVLCIISYLLAALSPYPVLALIGCGLCGLSVGILWPGTFSLAAAKCPKGGTAMFALFALVGDLGCSSGPTLVGMISSISNGGIKAGLMGALIFPVLLIVGLIWCKRIKT